MLSFLSVTTSIVLLILFMSIFTFLNMFFIKHLLMRIISVSIGVLGIGYVILIILNILGNPKPMNLDFFNNKMYYVISTKLVKDHAIYIWGVEQRENQPIYFVLPWHESTAARLTELRRTAISQGGTISFTPSAGGDGGEGDFTLNILDMKKE